MIYKVVSNKYIGVVSVVEKMGKNRLSRACYKREKVGSKINKEINVEGKKGRKTPKLGDWMWSRMLWIQLVPISEDNAENQVKWKLMTGLANSK